MGAPILHIGLPEGDWVDGSSWLPDGLSGSFRLCLMPGGLVVAHGVLTVSGSSGSRASIVPRELRPRWDAVQIALARYGSAQVLGSLGINASGTIALFSGVPHASPARFYETWAV